MCLCLQILDLTFLEKTLFRALASIDSVFSNQLFSSNPDLRVPSILGGACANWINILDSFVVDQFVAIVLLTGLQASRAFPYVRDHNSEHNDRGMHLLTICML